MTRITAIILTMILFVPALVSCTQNPGTTTAAPGTAAPESQTSAAEKTDIVDQLKLDLQSATRKLEVTVKQFVDGDTTHFHVPEDVDETGILKARYLGVNTPESTGTIEKWGKAASNFTKEKLSSAVSIYIESDDGNWNFDNTSSHRCLVWVWYKPAENADYRNLNLELLQEGYAIANSSANNRYGEYCMRAINQAKELQMRVYSKDPDPLFYEGAIQQVTVKALRTNPEPLLGTMISVEAVIVREFSNTLYVVDYDEGDGIYYGINVYYGFSVDPDLKSFFKIGNRVKFVGSLQFYEAGGTYQISGLSYKPRKPEESCQLVDQNNAFEYVQMTPAELVDGKKSILVSYRSESGDSLEMEKSFSTAELLLSTPVQLKDLKVVSVHTTQSEGSSNGAMTLTCEGGNGARIDVRTVALKDESGAVITEDRYQDQVIDVQGVVDYYDGTYQIKIFTAEDIVIH
ncbi:MAG: thermonuclease family protein [Lachnospiraceae bacterium]|nr:thermonuclease family protein [Lachnospiraceae bacterium]